MFTRALPGNPNGDPDNDNMPPMDDDTKKGLLTDVAIKRKIRNYVEMTRENEMPSRIYMREKAVLNRAHAEAYASKGVKHVPEKPAPEKDAPSITSWMCQQFYDIRAFGAVINTEVHAGQVRGPVQFNFSESVEPIQPDEIAITRYSVTNEKDAVKEHTMARKHVVPYGLYRCHGYVSANLSGRTGFSQIDLDLLPEALPNMLEHDRTAARAEMNAQKLIVFKHGSKFGNAPAQKLLRLIEIGRRIDGDFASLKGRPDSSLPPARSFDDYEIRIDVPGSPPVSS